MKILLIIPVYNEESNIATLINRIIQEYPLYDYLVVNDCSTDSTLSILQSLNANYTNAAVNLGIGGTVQTGYRYALQNNYDIAIQVDGDGQHDISFVETLIQPILNNKADICIGSRFIKKEGFQSSSTRRIGINLLSFLIFLCTGQKLKDVTSGFRAVNRRFIKIYATDYPQDFPEPEALVSAVMHGGRICEIPVIMQERSGGSSSIHSWKSIYYMIKVSLAILICRISFGIRRH